MQNVNLKPRKTLSTTANGARSRVLVMEKFARQLLDRHFGFFIIRGKDCAKFPFSFFLEEKTQKIKQNKNRKYTVM